MDNSIKSIFLVGGKHFYSKEKEKDYYTLDFLLVSEGGDSIVFKQFCNQESYENARRLLDMADMPQVPLDNLHTYISNGSLFTRINIDENIL